MTITRALPITAAALLALSGAAIAKDGADDGANHARHEAEARNDHHVSGTVKSFTGGVLTLTLRNGSTLTGKVTKATRVECEGADDGAGHDAGDDHGGRDGRGASGRAAVASCTIAAGDKVRDAEFRGAGASRVFEEVELAK